MGVSWRCSDWSLLGVSGGVGGSRGRGSCLWCRWMSPERAYGNTSQRQKTEEEANCNTSLIMQVSDGATRKPDNYSSWWDYSVGGRGGHQCNITRTEILLFMFCLWGCMYGRHQFNITMTESRISYHILGYCPRACLDGSRQCSMTLLNPSFQPKPSCSSTHFHQLYSFQYYRRKGGLQCNTKHDWNLISSQSHSPLSLAHFEHLAENSFPRNSNHGDK